MLLNWVKQTGKQDWAIQTLLTIYCTIPFSNSDFNKAGGRNIYDWEALQFCER